MYVYLVVLMLDATYAVHAPNVVFKTETNCLQFKELDKERLLKAKSVNPKIRDNAKFYATCIPIPADVETST